MGRTGELMADLVFKPARKKDRGAIVKLATALDPQDWLPEELDWAYAVSPGGLHVALIDDRPVAVSLITFPRPDEAFLAAMRVDASVQRKGIGRQFTAYLTKRAQQLGAAVVRLSVDHDNEPSKSLVAKAGFEALADWRIYLDLSLELDLPASGVAVPGARNMAQVRTYFNNNLKRSNPAGLGAMNSSWDICSMGWSDIQAAIARRGVLLRHGKEGVEGALIYGYEPGEAGDARPLIRYFEGEKVAREHLLRYFARTFAGREFHASLPELQGLGLEDSLPEPPPAYRQVIYQLSARGDA